MSDGEDIVSEEQDLGEEIGVYYTSGWMSFWTKVRSLGRNKWVKRSCASRIQGCLSLTQCEREWAFDDSTESKEVTKRM